MHTEKEEKILIEAEKRDCFNEKQSLAKKHIENSEKCKSIIANLLQKDEKQVEIMTRILKENGKLEKEKDSLDRDLRTVSTLS